MSGAPPRPFEGPPLLRQRWQTINPAHSIQRVVAVVSFPQELPSFVVQKAVDAVRVRARAMGMVKEEPINKAIVQVGPGGAHVTSPHSQEGTVFQDQSAGQIVQALSLSREAIRFESLNYTRWLAFRNQLSGLLAVALPPLSAATPVLSIGLEYFDFFFAVSEGPEDASLIVDKQSNLIAQRAFRKRDPFHAHSGWFERENAESRRVVNVDITVGDQLGPIGARRTITIRTFEAEHVKDMASARGIALINLSDLLAGMDTLHVSLKERIGHILTRDAKNMISLGS